MGNSCCVTYQVVRPSRSNLILCACGSAIRPSLLQGHLRTQKHIDYERQVGLKDTHAVHPVKIATFPRHIISMMIEREKTCPICLEDFTLDTVHITHCGHTICCTCRPPLKQCPVCRATL